METKDLAEFYGVTRQSVEKWTPEKRKQKTVQALSCAKQPIVDLIADISKLVFIFNCKWLHGEKQVKCQDLHIEGFRVDVTGTDLWGSANLESDYGAEQLLYIKTKLEELVYGVSTIDKRS